MAHVQAEYDPDAADETETDYDVEEDEGFRSSSDVARRQVEVDPTHRQRSCMWLLL